MNARRAEWGIYEPDPFGHHSEFLRHLLAHAGPGAETIHLAVSPAFVSGCWEREDWRGGIDASRVRVHVLSDDETRQATTGPLWRRSLSRWASLKRVAAAAGAAAWIVTEMDQLLLPLAFGRRLPGGARIIGILYRPSLHYPRLGRASVPTFPERIRDLKKAVLYHGTIRNPVLRHIFCLDTLFPAYARERFGRHGAIFEPLPDPVPQVQEPLPSRGQQAPYPAVRLLLFGALTARKGVLEALEGLRLLEPSVRARIRLTLAGKVDDAIREEVDRKIEALRQAVPPAEVALRPGFLPEPELQALIEEADVVLAPYQRFVGSSGVLLRAAAAGRPVISQEYGYLGWLVREHGLGIATRTDPGSIARAIEVMAASDPADAIDREAAAAFVAGHTPAAFATPLLRAVGAHVG